MTKEEFTGKIREGWPGSALPQIEAIGNDIQYLTDEQRDNLFSYFLENFPYQKATASGFRKIMKESGIKQRRVDLSEYAYCCRECGRIFAGRNDWTEVSCCPGCFSRDMDIVKDPKKAEVQTYQPPCLIGWSYYNPGSGDEPEKGFSRCPIWEGGGNPFGPSCNFFGVSPGKTEDCMACSCRNCCEAIMREKLSLSRGLPPAGQKYL